MRRSSRVWFHPLHWAECFNAVAQQVFQGKITRANAEKVFHDLQQDRLSGLWVEIALPDSAFELCADLAHRYGPTLGTRTLDTLHVACAMEFGADQFLTFDERQAKLARAVGLRT